MLGHQRPAMPIAVDLGRKATKQLKTNCACNKLASLSLLHLLNLQVTVFIGIKLEVSSICEFYDCIAVTYDDYMYCLFRLDFSMSCLSLWYCSLKLPSVYN